MAEGELFEREMDWLAVQRLKVCVLLEERGTRLKLTQAGQGHALVGSGQRDLNAPPPRC